VCTESLIGSNLYFVGSKKPSGQYRDFATPKDGLIYDKANKDRIGKLKGFSLLFAHSFPVMRKSFPVIFHDEFR
jgi:hypothetical protein